MSIRHSASNIVKGNKIEENVVVEETHAFDDEAYHVGLMDRSLFDIYENHVVRQKIMILMQPVTKYTFFFLK